jgi:hypothetical protein
MMTFPKKGPGGLGRQAGVVPLVRVEEIVPCFIGADE